MAAMLPETAWDGGAKLGCCMVTGGAALDGRISVVGPCIDAKGTSDTRPEQLKDQKLAGNALVLPALPAVCGLLAP